MRLTQPSGMIVAGFLLVLVGFLLPLFMTLRVIQASFLLSFLSYAASMGGLILGLVGAAMARGRNKH